MVISNNDYRRSDLVKQFMCATQLTKINIENKSINDVIDTVLLMLSKPILEKYPLNTGYIVRFLKKIINQVENNNEMDSYDELYLKYIKLIQMESNEGPFYKHYMLHDDIEDQLFGSIITIQESTSIVSQGTTGLCTWQAGVALSCWCIKNRDKFEDKFIVELGCGTGLSGISICTNCKPREYWFTDCHSTVLNTLKHNIQINEKHNKFNCVYDTIQLSWDNIEDLKLFEEKKPDLVLAADVVFDQSMFEPLCNFLRNFMMNNTTEIILFCTIRNPETYKQFLETLRKYKLNFIQDILPGEYSTILQQDCPISVVNVKQNTSV